MAQLVARDVWDVDAAGSNPVTPTNTGIHKAFEYQKRGFDRKSKPQGNLCGFSLFELQNDRMIGGTICLVI